MWLLLLRAMRSDVPVATTRPPRSPPSRPAVHAPMATALADVPRTDTQGPWPADFELMAASEGEDVVVVWDDARASAPGVYARRLRCTVNG